MHGTQHLYSVHEICDYRLCWHMLKSGHALYMVKLPFTCHFHSVTQERLIKTIKQQGAWVFQRLLPQVRTR